MSRFFILLLLMFASWLSHANVEVYQFDNPAQEETYKELIEELRCLVCQNQSIAPTTGRDSTISPSGCGLDA